MKSYWDYNLAVIVTFLIVTMTNQDFQQLRFSNLCYNVTYHSGEEFPYCQLNFFENSLHHKSFLREYRYNGYDYSEYYFRIDGCTKETFHEYMDTPFADRNYLNPVEICCSNFDDTEPLLILTAVILFTLMFSQVFESTLINLLIILIRLAFFGGYSFIIFRNYHNVYPSPFCEIQNELLSSCTIMFVEVYCAFCLIEFLRCIRVAYLNRGALSCRNCFRNINYYHEIEVPKDSGLSDLPDAFELADQPDIEKD